MHVYTKIYEFAATVGAFEGYVYGKKKINADELTNWVQNIVSAYGHMPADVREKFQTPLDGTLGRAIQSLVGALGDNHELVMKLRTLLAKNSIKSADDFQYKKWFREESKDEG